MNIKINKKEFNWARPLRELNLSSVTAISLHHVEHLTADMDAIHKWHLDRGWAGFAYNYWVNFKGEIYEGRGLNKGAGLYDPLNETVISIGFQGHFDVMTEMPEAQFEAGTQLIAYLKTIIPTINFIEGHRYWQPEKTCPGKYFPMEDMIKTSEAISKIKDYDQVSDWAKDAVLKVVGKGIMIGDDQGRFNPRTPITRQEVAVVVSRLLELFGAVR